MRGARVVIDKGRGGEEGFKRLVLKMICRKLERIREFEEENLFSQLLFHNIDMHVLTARS